MPGRKKRRSRVESGDIHVTIPDVFGATYVILETYSGKDNVSFAVGKHRNGHPVLSEFTRKKNLDGVGQLTSIQYFERLDILRELDHHNIPKMEDFFDYEDQYVIVSNYTSGSPLDKYIGKRGPLPEKACKYLILTLLEILNYMHGVGVVHRNITPHTIKLLSKSGHIELGGLSVPARYRLDDVSMQVAALTGDAITVYSAPEIRTENHGPQADMYSVGMVMYFIVTGINPENVEAMEFRRSVWCDNYEKYRVKDLVLECLNIDPSKRPTPSSMKTHPWFANTLLGQFSNSFKHKGQ